MDLKDIDKELQRLQQLREEALKLEEERKREAGLREARDIIGRLVDDLRRLHELDHVPPRLREALLDAQGKWNPGLYIKRPKGAHSSKT